MYNTGERSEPETRGPKGHIKCTWVQCATFLKDWPGRPSCFSDLPKNTNFVEDVEIFLPVKFRCRPFSGFRGEVENVSANQRPGRPSCFSNRPEKHKLRRGRWNLASCIDSFVEFRSAVSEKWKMSQPIRGQGGHLVFPIGPKKKTNLVEDVKILLPVKFCWIPFSAFRWEVENVKS